MLYVLKQESMSYIIALSQTIPCNSHWIDNHVRVWNGWTNQTQMVAIMFRCWTIKWDRCHCSTYSGKPITISGILDKTFIYVFVTSSSWTERTDVWSTIVIPAEKVSENFSPREDASCSMNLINVGEEWTWKEHWQSMCPRWTNSDNSPSQSDGFTPDFGWYARKWIAPE